MYKVGESVACIGIINHFEGADRLAETLKQASELKWTKGFQFGYKRACEEVLELLGGK